MKHNRWLDWKIKHGLAIRGRSKDVPMEPKGMLARFLYKRHFKKQDVKSTKPRVFNQSVGGTLGPSGEAK
jgi:hypothetical protein